MKYMFLGGAGEVGASCLLILTADRNILIDCGIRVNQRGSDALPDLDLLKGLGRKLDAIFISHAHADHIGALPLVHQMFPSTPIYSTAPTCFFTQVMLSNALKVMETNDAALFKQEAVRLVIEQMARSMLHTEAWYPLWDGWQVMFIFSGHILGAVSIVLDTPEGKFLYSGDVSEFHQKTIDGIRDLSGINPDLMWCESTYGDGNHPSRTSEEQKLVLAVAEVIDNGGSVLIPSFALGRAQEIILILKQAMESKVIPTFPVVVDGLVTGVCKGYEKQGSIWEGIGTSLRKWRVNSLKGGGSIFFSKSVKAAHFGKREEILKDKNPKCIIASSGMLTGGASVDYAKALAPGANNAIFLSGYQDAESPGRRLQELQQGDELAFADGSVVEVKCNVQRFHLSAHSDQQQIVSMIKRANPKAVALVHGEHSAMQALREKLYKQYIVTCPVNGGLVDSTEKPEWIPSETLTKIDEKVDVPVNIEVNIDGSIQVSAEDAESDRYQTFADGKHVARIKGNRLIITKK